MSHAIRHTKSEITIFLIFQFGQIGEGGRQTDYEKFFIYIYIYKLKLPLRIGLRKQFKFNFGYALKAQRVVSQYSESKKLKQ